MHHAPVALATDSLPVTSMHCRRPAGVQLLSYFLTVLLFPVTCFASTALAFPVCTIGIIASYVFVYAQNIYLTFYDASPDELISKRKQGIRPAKFDPKRHDHVIERGFCNICQIHVQDGTKHCRRCNVCVEGFDHHCIWMNNCIGKKNYRKFIVLLTSIVAFSSAATILGFIQMFCWISRTEEMKDSAAVVFPYKIPYWVWLLASFAAFISHFVIAATTGHLLQFHIRLWQKGITTYRFIVDQRQRKTVSRETISAQQEASSNIGHAEELAVEKLRDSLTPKVRDVQQRHPSYMLTDKNHNLRNMN